MSNIICKNCDQAFDGHYCPNCSQAKTGNSRLHFKNVVREFVDSLFNFDRGLVYTFWNLLKRPHFVARSFIEGKRKRFTSPVKYFILFSILQALFVYLFLDREEGIPSIRFPFLSDETNQGMDAWNQIVTLDYPILLGIINVFVWTVMVYILFKKSKYNFTELLVTSLYFYGTIFILINFSAVIYNPIMHKTLPSEWVSLLGFGYMLFAYIPFFKEESVYRRLIKIILVFMGLFVFRIFILPISMAWLFPIN